MRAQRMNWVSATLLTAGMSLPTLAAPPSQLPLLDPGTRIGVVYSGSDEISGPAAEGLWVQAYGAGIDVYELALSWEELEFSPGVVDTAYLDALLEIIEDSGLVPYLVLMTANTNLLSIPEDLKDPANPSQLRADLTWDHPTVLTRFHALLDQVVPELVARGGFYLSVGNEVDILLSRSATETQAFAAFAGSARAHAQAMEPELAVGVNLTIEAIEEPSLLAAMMSVSDVASFTYYPMEGFDVRDPSEVGADLDAFLEAAAGKPVLLQEVGYPSGWREASAGTPGAGPGGGPTNESSEARQAEFVRTFFQELMARPQIRMASVLQLADWSGPTLDFLESYYGFASPGFREFLGTLGLAWEDGTPKPGFAEFLTGVCRVQRARADLNGDGVLDNGDIGAFVNAFIVQGLAADLNGDGIVDNGDIATFVRLFLRSC